MKTITLALTIYKQPLNQVSRWFDNLREIKSWNFDFLQILAITDNPNLQEYYFDLADEYNIELLSTDKNLKRSLLIQEKIKEGVITGDYIKLLDPDDYVNLEEMKKLVLEISKQNEFFINIHKVSRLKEDFNSPTNFYNEQKIQFEVWNHPVNFNTFYIREDIISHNLKKSFNLLDDFYWSSLSMIKGRKAKLIDIAPYIWSDSAGISNASFSKKSRNYKIYDNLDAYNQQMNFYSEFLSIENYERNFFPFGFWLIRSAQNSIIASKKIGKNFSIKALILMMKFMKKYKKIYNAKRKIPLYLKIHIYGRTIFGRKI